MKRLVLVLLVACKHDAAGPDTIELPLATGDPVGNAVVFERLDVDRLVEVDPASVFGDRSKPFHALAASGTLTASGRDGKFGPGQPHDPYPPKAPYALFFDRTDIAGLLKPYVDVLHDRCWGFAVADHAKLELLEPAPCPPPAPAFVIEMNHRHAVVPETKAGSAISFVGDDLLREVLAAHKGESVGFTFSAQTTLAEMVDTFAIAHAAGVTAATWVTR